MKRAATEGLDNCSDDLSLYMSAIYRTFHLRISRKNVDPRPGSLVAHARRPIRSIALRTIASQTRCRDSPATVSNAENTENSIVVLHVKPDAVFAHPEHITTRRLVRADLDL